MLMAMEGFGGAMRISGHSRSSKEAVGEEEQIEGVSGGVIVAVDCRGPVLDHTSSQK